VDFRLFESNRGGPKTVAAPEKFRARQS